MLLNTRNVSLKVEDASKEIKAGQVLGYKVVSGQLVVAPIATGYEYIGVAVDTHNAIPDTVDRSASIVIGVGVSGQVDAYAEANLNAGVKVKPGVAGGFVEAGSDPAVGLTLTEVISGQQVNVLLF